MHNSYWADHSRSDWVHSRNLWPLRYGTECVREIERLGNEAGDRPASFAELILISRSDQEPLLPERAEELRVHLFSCRVGEASQQRPATSNNISPNELIEFSSISTLTHLVKPRGEDAAVPSCGTARLFKRGWCTAPTASFGNLSRLSWCHAQCRRTDMHHLPFGPRSNETQLCNAATDQRDTRAVWCALCKCAQKGESVRRVCQGICVVNDEG
jgi:hypothetical protein